MVTRSKKNKPWMTEDHKKARRIWAEQHLQWSRERWRHILWSDESPFTLFIGPRGGKVWIKKTMKKREKEEGFKVLDWPSQSPDLSPIENIWSHLKLQLKQRKVYPKTKEQLWGYVQEEWAKLPPDLLLKLADSMPKRCQVVIAAHGGPIDY